MKDIPCPCGGVLEWKKEKVLQSGIDCGIIDVEICKKCKTQYLPEESMIIVESILKKQGLWGHQGKEVKFWKTGNTITIRLPTEFTQELGLLQQEKGTLYKEGPRKFAIEF